MDEWLRHHLIETGVISADGHSRKAKATTCRRCNGRTLTGLDADVAGGLVEIDDREVDQVGEVLALAQGIPTYTLRFTGGRWEIDYRYAIEIHGRREWPIYPRHVCGVFYPHAPLHPKLAKRYTRKPPLPDIAPF